MEAIETDIHRRIEETPIRNLLYIAFKCSHCLPASGLRLSTISYLVSADTSLLNAPVSIRFKASMTIETSTSLFIGFSCRAYTIQ